MLKTISTSQIVLNEKKQFINVTCYKFTFSYRYFFERVIKSYIFSDCLFFFRNISEILSSCQDGLTQIQCKSLYSVICPKRLFRDKVYIQDCSLLIMVPRMQERNHLLKRILDNQIGDEARSFKKTMKLLEQGDYQGLCKIQMPISSIMATMKKYGKRESYRIFLSSP